MNHHKRGIADLLLTNGSLYIHLDPRVHDVVVPPWLRHQAHLVLQVGYAMPVPIPDLAVNDICLFGTLSFAKTKFTCVIPWRAVFALVGDVGRGQVWSEDMPFEVKAEMDRLRSSLADTQPIPAPVPIKRLEYVKGGAKRRTPAIGVLRRVK